MLLNANIFIKNLDWIAVKRTLKVILKYENPTSILNIIRF